MTRPGKITSQAGSNLGSSALEGDALTTRPARRSSLRGKGYILRIVLCGTTQPCRAMSNHKELWATWSCFPENVDVQNGTLKTSRHNAAKTDCLVGLVVKASVLRAEDPGFESRLQRDNSGSSHTSDLKLALQWLPCQVPGMIGSVLGLVGPVSIYCD